MRLGAAALTLGLAALLYFQDLAKLRPAGGDHWPLLPLLVLGVWAGDTHPIKIRNRKMGMAIGLTEIPILVGIVFLQPGLCLAVAFIGHLAASIKERRPPLTALTNLSVYPFSVALGVLVYDRLMSGAASGRLRSPVDLRGWTVGVLTVAVIAVADLVLMLVTSALVDKGWRRPPVLPILVQLGAYIGLCTAGGLVAVSLVWVNIWGAGLFILIAVAANLAYRATVVAGQRYANLEKLYDFTRRLSVLSEDRDVTITVLEEARTLLLASRGELVVPLDAPLDGLVLRCSLDGEEGPASRKRSPFPASTH